jgi:hypothetical protein
VQRLRRAASAGICSWWARKMERRYSILWKFRAKMKKILQKNKLQLHLSPLKKSLPLSLKTKKKKKRRPSSQIKKKIKAMDPFHKSRVKNQKNPLNHSSLKMSLKTSSNLTTKRNSV